jgi:hypothetical protein
MTSHIARVWEWICVYMYIRILLDTTCFKVVMVMNLSELRSDWESSTGMGDLLESLVQGSQKQTILCHLKWVITQVSKWHE